MAKYKDIEYTLKRSLRKTASIYIERDGGVSVLVPDSFTDIDLTKLLEGKRTWIYKQLAEWEDLNSTRIQRQFVNGEGFLYLGRTYRLEIVKDQPVPLSLKNGYFCLRASTLKSGDISPDEAFKEFYRQKGKVKISERVDLYKRKMGVKPQSIHCLDLKNRWASCNSSGRLNFHWKCMMAPLKILDYIVVHELAHLLHPSHTQAFWNEVDKMMPDFEERKAWLRRHGSSMDL